MSTSKRPRVALCVALTSCLAALPCHADPPPPPAPTQQWESTDPAVAVRDGSPQAQELIGYQTEPGHRLPILMLPTYQSARRLWTAGFSTTMGGLGVLATGVGVLLVGGYSDGLTDGGRRNGMIAGGTLTGLGAAGVVVGSVLWHFGRRDLLNLESRLPNKDGILSPSAILPSLSVIPETGGGQRVMAGLAGRF